MKRLMIVFLMLLLLLTGCAKLDINVGIKEDHTAFLNYYVELDTTSMSEVEQKQLPTVLNKLIIAYEKYGFKSQADFTGDIYKFSLKNEKKFNNYKDAYRHLKDMLINADFTFLTEVDMDSYVTDYEQGFSLKVKTDFAKIFQTSSLVEMPKYLSKRIYEGYEQSQVNFIFELPKSETVEHSENIEVVQNKTTTVYTGNVSLEQETEFLVVARMGVANGKVSAKSIDERIVSFDKNQLIYLGGAVVSLVACILFLVFWLKKRNNEKVSNV